MELYDKNRRWQYLVNPWRHASQYNNKVECEKNKGKWVEFSNYLEITDKSKAECISGPGGERLIWAIPYRSEHIDQLKGDNPEQWKKCLVVPDPPDCRQTPYSRSNHLGNGEGVVPLSYDWTLPHFPSGEEQRCVLRIRYG